MGINSSGQKKEKGKEKSSNTVQIIDTVDDLEKFEENLEKKGFRETVFQHWTARMGTDCGLGSGKSKAYDLADEMFSRRFFTNFTWTGLSAKNESKIALQKYKRMIDMFWKIIFNCDNSFNSDMNKKFLQNLMNKSKARSDEVSTNKRKRSAPKKRPKNLKYKMKINVGPQETPIGDKQFEAEEPEKIKSASEGSGDESEGSGDESEASEI